MPVIRVGKEIVAQCAGWRNPGLEGKRERGETCGFTFFASLYFYYCVLSESRAHALVD